MQKFVRPGQRAPDFSAKTLNKGDLVLSRRVKDAPFTLLVFSRYWGCPVCQYEFRELLDARLKFGDAGIQVIYINQSSEENGRTFLEEVPFPVISAPLVAGTKHEYEIYQEFGVGPLGITSLAGIAKKALKAKRGGFVHGESEGYERQSPAQVLIDGEMIVVNARKGLLDLGRVFEAIGGGDSD
ncbi:MAG: redoxin domain-containing protein [Promethearchaeota archaeon]